MFFTVNRLVQCGTVLVKLKGFQKLTLTDQALQTWFSALQIGKPKDGRGAFAGSVRSRFS